MRHLLSTADLSRAEAVRVLDVAEQMAATQQREIKKLPTLRGRTVVNLFFEDSTRTRISFETAAKRLSADVITFSAKGSLRRSVRIFCSFSSSRPLSRRWEGCVFCWARSWV